MHLLGSVTAGRWEPAHLRVRARSDATDERLAVAHVGAPLGAHPLAVGRLRRAHPHLPVRVRGAGSIATHHRVRGARHLRCVPGDSPRGAEAAAEGLATWGPLGPGAGLLRW